MADSSPDPHESRADALVEACLERMETEGSKAVDEICAQNPEFATEIRRRLEALRALGIVGDPGHAPGGSPPEQLGEFRIVREIGRGGMGVVYLAEQVSLGRQVALKVLPTLASLSPTSVERFRREASTAARLRHPGIVEVYAIGEERGAHYIAMELIEGSSLENVLRRLRSKPSEQLHGRHVGEIVGGGVAPTTRGSGNSTKGSSGAGSRGGPVWDRTYVETICRVLVQVADALEFAHQQGVLHRDVKPANILLRTNGSVVLTDFGLAREESLPSLTRTSDFTGTPSYVSPEQARVVNAPVDARTDVYALGVTLFEALTLHLPFEGDTAHEVFTKLGAEEPPSPRRFRPSIPRDLETIVLKALEKQPSRRYGTVQALADDLRAFLEFRPISARPAGFATHVGKALRRRPAFFGTLAAGLAAAAMAGVYWWVQPGQLVVTSKTAGAAVFVDGVHRGFTKDSEPLLVEVSPGAHRVRLEKSDQDLASQEEEVTVRRGQSRPLDRSLASLRGIVELLSTPPGAEVMISDGGGAIVKRARAPELVALRAGAYRAQFVFEGFPPISKPIDVLPGGAQVQCTADWAVGELVIDAEQDNLRLEVFSGRSAEGVKPFKSAAIPLDAPLLLPEGEYSLRARRDGCHRWEASGPMAIHIQNGGRTVASVRLAPLEHRMETQLDRPVFRVAAADLNGDGSKEVIAFSASGQTLIGSADGSQMTLGASHRGAPTRFVARDLDGDGIDELVVAASSYPGLLWMNREAKASVTVGLSLAPVDLVALDSDGDGDLEVAAATTDQGPRSRRGEVILLDSRGSERLRLPEMEAIENLAARDLDGDGREELMICFRKGEIRAIRSDGSDLWRVAVSGQSLGIISNPQPEIGFAALICGATMTTAIRADGTTAFTLPTKQGEEEVLLRDFDGDGRSEAVLRDLNKVVLRKGDGTLLRLDAPPGRIYPAAMDLDGDGLDELIVGMFTGRLAAMKLDGTIPFDEQILRGAVSQFVAPAMGPSGPFIAVGGESSGVCLVDRAGQLLSRIPYRGTLTAGLVDDLEGDGFTDIVIGTSAKQALSVSSKKTVQFEISSRDRAHGRVVDFFDAHGDSAPEIVVGFEPHDVLVLAPSGKEVMELKTSRAVMQVERMSFPNSGAFGVAAMDADGVLYAFDRDGKVLWTQRMRTFFFHRADLDGDGHLDFVSRVAAKYVTACGADGAKLWEREIPTSIRDVIPADLDGDGRLELVVLTPAQGVFVLGLDGTVLRSFALAPNCAEFLVWDLDGDRKAEILAIDVDDVMHVYRSDGKLWWEHSRIRHRIDPVIHDLDGDMRPEIVAAFQAADMVVMSAEGRPVAIRRLGDRVNFFFAEDLDGDGQGEVIVGVGNELIVMDRHLQTKFTILRDSLATSVRAADLDGDGIRELLVTSASAGTAIYSAASVDARARRRIQFLDALAAAERGDEAAAKSGFKEAGFQWLPFDSTALEAIRWRLRTAPGPAAASAAEFLDRVRPPRGDSAWIAVEELIFEGAFAKALEVYGRLRREHLYEVPAFRLQWIATLYIDERRGPCPKSAVPLMVQLAGDLVALTQAADAESLEVYALALALDGQRGAATQALERALAACSYEQAELALRLKNRLREMGASK
ncbi:MAG: protein kinase [Planctomycetes bacterium]|nr:protein kinase [Planctomycetota bacterium]